MSIPGHALFISSVQLHKQPSGIRRRFELLLDAVARISDRVEFLLFITDRFARLNEEFATELAASIAERWPIHATVRLCPLDPAPRLNGLRDRYLSASLSIYKLPRYCRYAGATQLGALEACLETGPRFIMVQRLHCMVPLLRTRRVLPPVFFDMDDVEHTALRRSIGQPPVWLSKYLEYLHLPALLVGEYRALGRARRAFVCSRRDERKLEVLFRTRNVATLPNAVRVPDLAPAAAARQILLVGAFGYAPNCIGAEYFLDRIWPLIRARVADARIVMAGSTPERVRHSAAPPPGVSFTGFVADLAPLYHASRFAICPILSGSGTRVKIIEAAAYARPTVSTPVGAEGLEFIDGKEILLRGGAEAFAGACIELLADLERCQELGSAARRRVEEVYDRRKVADSLVWAIEEQI